MPSKVPAALTTTAAARPQGGHSLDHLHDRSVRQDFRQLIVSTHDLMDLQQQGPSESTGGMVTCEILLVEARASSSTIASASR